MAITKQLDSNNRDLDGLYQSGNQTLVQPQVGTVTTDVNNGNQTYGPQVVQLGDKTTPTNFAAVDATGLVEVTTGGLKTVAVAAAAAAAAIKTTPGRLHKVHVTTLGTAALNFYDAASATGTILCAVPASAAVGSTYDVQMPAAIAIWCNSGTNTPAVTVAYS